MMSSRWTAASFDEALDLSQHAAAATEHAASERLDEFHVIVNQLCPILERA
jgi:hypothetical protein